MHQQMTTSYLAPSPPDTLVLSARHPADELSSCRLHSRSPEGATSLMILPGDMRPSLGHLGMLADISTAQAVAVGLQPGSGIRTLGLQLHLAQNLKPGELIHGSGEQLSFDDISGLSRSTMTADNGMASAIATGRFIVVQEQYAAPGSSTLEPLSTVPTPSCWDDAYGIQEREVSDGRALLTAVPDNIVRNHGPMMHGGMQVRALELAMSAAAGPPAGPPGFTLTDINITFHRPVPVDGDTPIFMRGEVQRRGRRTVIVTATLETPEGRLLSSSEGVYLAGNDHH